MNPLLVTGRLRELVDAILVTSTQSLTPISVLTAALSSSNPLNIRMANPLQCCP
jgi:hypothetical protein